MKKLLAAAALAAALCLWASVPAKGQETAPQQETAGADAGEGGALDGSLPEDYFSEGTGLEMVEGLRLDEIEESLGELLGTERFSFKDTVLGLLRGEIPFHRQEITGLIVDALTSEVRQQRKLMLQILFVVLTAAVFSNFTRVFQSSQISDICFYMMDLLLAVLLMHSFAILNEIARGTLESLISLMNVLLPAYLLTIVFSAGTLTATGISEILLFAFSLMEVFMRDFLIPAVNFYLVLQLINQMSREDYFSKFAELFELVINWGVKSAFGVVIGLQTVQCLIMPAVDALKNGMLHKAAKAIPGIGNTLDAAAETIAGAAVVIRNAVGSAGMAAILFLCLVPVAKLVCCILMLRLLCAVIQPLGESRLVESVSCVAGATALLLRIVLYAMGIFMISVAMIMAAVRG